MALILRQTFLKTDKETEISDRYYSEFDSTFEKYLNHEAMEFERLHSSRQMGREIIVNIHEHDREFTRIEVEINLSESKKTVDFRIKHDGNSFDPFADDSQCSFIKAEAHFLKIKRVQPTTLSGSGRPRESIRFSFDLVPEKENPDEV